MSVGERIQARRSALGLTQVELARAVDVAPMTISKWERGVQQPGLPFLARMADALGCSVDWIVRGVGEPPTEGQLKATGTEG